MRFAYSSFVRLYYLFILFASFGNKKAKLWIQGRRNWIILLKENQIKGEVYWFHCASLGEFEQGRPIMESIRKQDPKAFILVSFFSPSGFEIRKNSAVADYVCYLPLDTTGNAIQFIQIVQPKMVFFVKYEFWFNFLKELKTRNIPTYLISGIFRKDQHFFKWYGSWFRKQLNSFKYFFLQNEEAHQLLRNIGFDNSTICGDTRFDRVRKVLENPQKIDLLESNKDSRDIIIIGSNWPEDDGHLLPFINENTNGYQFVIAPHNINESQLKRLESKINASTLRLSRTKNDYSDKWDVLLIDSIGKLSSIYQYGKLAYIGGGFGSNVHNILEAATYGLPTIFGPNFHKFQECKDLIELKGAFCVHNTSEIINTVQMLSEKHFYQTASEVSRNYVKEKSGATEIILSKLFQLPE